VTTTMTIDQAAPRRAQLDHRTAGRLAATEYQRFAAQLRALTPEQWSAATTCPDWDVRAMAGHLLGMAKMAASLREQSRQMKAAHARGGVFIDALTAVQVEEHAHLSTDQLLDDYERYGHKAARARRRTPPFIRRRRLPELQHVNGADESWTIGFLTDVVLTRDPWLHRIEIARAIGTDPHHTADHDGVIVADVVREWASRHGRPCSLQLSGPAGGTWAFGHGGPQIELDTVDFALRVSRRASTAAVFDTEVPF
jgi:uncharacterized protein (TIGR03083 family)